MKTWDGFLAHAAQSRCVTSISARTCVQICQNPHLGEGLANPTYGRIQPRCFDRYDAHQPGTVFRVDVLAGGQEHEHAWE
jgi:hypothetical protein